MAENDDRTCPDEPAEIGPVPAAAPDAEEAVRAANPVRTPPDDEDQRSRTERLMAELTELDISEIEADRPNF